MIDTIVREQIKIFAREKSIDIVDVIKTCVNLDAKQYRDWAFATGIFQVNAEYTYSNQYRTELLKKLQEHYKVE